MKHLKFVWLFTLFLQSGNLYAQIIEDTVYGQNEVVINGSRLENFTAGNKIQIIDSAIISNNSSGNIGDLLAQHTHAFIKASGPGNHASISMRGSGAHHTAILWNGFNVQNVTLGQADFSFLPAGFAEHIKIQYGGGSALYGSGAIGGTIHLSNKPVFNQGLQAGITGNFGSYNRFFQSMNLKLSKKKFVSSIKLYNFNAQNNFPFINTALSGNPEVRQTNARVEQQGLLIENYFKIRQNQQLDIALWLQDNFRQVPPSMTGAVSGATLENKFSRLSAQWKRSGKRSTLFIRTGYFNEHMPYQDTISNINSNTHFQSLVSEVESNIYIGGNQLVNIGINNTYTRAQSEGYETAPEQNRTALFASYRLQNKTASWKTVASLRQEFVGSAFVPVTPSIGLEGRLVKGVKVKANVSRNYRIPTFNDLYWRPGGNPDLHPESGWNEELSIILSKQLKTLKNKLAFTFFNSNINNRIIWLPASGYWSPRNIQAVWSRGLECNFKSSIKIGQVETNFSVLYSYVVSTNEKTKSINDNSVKKQLIYVPVYSGQGAITITYRKFYLSYIHTYTGNRFTSADNTSYASAYQLGNVSFSRNIDLDKFRININAKVNNIWNEAYQVVLWQAMPLRNYQLGVSVYFNQSGK